MLHLKRILFATDGSDCAERARDHAFFLAGRFEAILHVVRVEERSVSLSEVIDIREDDILADLHAPYEQPPRNLPEPRLVEQTIVHSSAAHGILAYAVEYDADLIVLGTHGHRGGRRLVLGSVAEEVLRRAECPVLIVGGESHAPVEEVQNHMLVPVDFSAHQERLLEHVREIALVYDVELTLLHVIERKRRPDVYGAFSKRPEPEVLADRSVDALNEVAGPLREVGLTVNVSVRDGHPAPEILSAVDDFGINLIAIATHGRTGLQRMLMGSVAEKVIRRATRPVFTVRSFGKSLVSHVGQREYG